MASFACHLPYHTKTGKNVLLKSDSDTLSHELKKNLKQSQSLLQVPTAATGLAPAPAAPAALAFGISPQAAQPIFAFLEKA